MLNIAPVLGYTDQSEAKYEWSMGYRFVVKSRESQFYGSIISRSDKHLLLEFGITELNIICVRGDEDEFTTVTVNLEVK